ncbi:hypothetical protein BU25DRAFT_463583 [Macroventuria anomochaeta]|uniref:Uncharacterized protein n=1 Tax=Macroventuria anomochaeta TaxID=301207 RepID=A0ACB6RI90_9PLEO|nr:uncharacterized protein BU25DRAFT_463583 [Macroventuria anomochaeta]KAF2621630.1 hypothetical protein BU25DRAFT_463583 [Macroventuria anomochaeta]
MISRSQNIATAIAGMVVVDSAYSCQSLCYAIPSKILHRKYRAYGQAATHISSGIGGLSGVLVGGAHFRSNVPNWRIYWYICAALFAFGLVGVFFGYKPPKRELEVAMGPKEKLRRMDWIGSYLIAPGLVLLVIALQYSFNPYTWTDGHVLGRFVGSIICLAAFSIWKWKGTSSGILGHCLFCGRKFPLAVVAMFVEGLAFFNVTNYFAYELVFLHHIHSFTGNLRFTFGFISLIVMAFIVGVYTGSESRSLLANSFGYAAFAGSGLGFILSNLMVAAHMGTPPDMISLCSGLVTALRSLGGATGLAINHSVFNSSLQSQIPSRVAAAVLPLGFSPQNLPALIGALSSQKESAVRVTGGFQGSILIGNPKSESKEYIDPPVEIEVAFA